MALAIERDAKNERKENLDLVCVFSCTLRISCNTYCHSIY